jgi:hypothetical protein
MREGEGSRLLSVSESTGDACREAEVRREISSRRNNNLEREQRGRREDIWAIYRRDCLRRGLGFRGSGGDGRHRESRARPGLLDGGRRRLTHGAGVSATGGIPIRDLREAGPWAPFWTGLKSFPAAFLLSFFCFFFLISDLFCIFCKFASNPIKPLSAIF